MRGRPEDAPAESRKGDSAKPPAEGEEDVSAETRPDVREDHSAQTGADAREDVSAAARAETREDVSAATRAEAWEGASPESWRARWGLPLLEVHRSLPSTNDRVRELAREGAPAFAAVIAEEQTAGRGRQGRGWSSPPGRGLWISLLLGRGAPDGLALAPILLGLAAARAVEEATDGTVQVGVKWPNDLIVDGMKVGGVLCEAWGEGGRRGRSAVAAGVGINVSQRPDDFPAELRPPPPPGTILPLGASSLEMLAGRAVDRAELAAALLRHVRVLLPDGGATPRPESAPSAPAPIPGRLSAAAHEELGSRDVLRGRRVALSLPIDAEAGPPPASGVAAGIDREGALLVLDGSGKIRHIIAGSVRVIE